MEPHTPTINTSLKNIELENEGNKYNCKIHVIKQFLNISLYLDNILKYEGYIPLYKIQMQIEALISYNINEIYEEINILNKDK